MAGFPLKIKRRDSSGAVVEILCDTVEGAQENLKHFRDAGYTQVWVEDVDGRELQESDL